jgi:hypothetical protein
MHITIKSFATAFLSLLFPGLGQVFYGKWIWAFAWFGLAVFFTPLVAWFAAAHCFFIE